MQRGTDIVVGTPGRIKDLMNTRELLLDQVTHFVLDEGDQMLDFGFIRDIRTIMAALPAQRQSMLFSATMPAEVGKLASSLLRDPVRVQVASDTPTPDKIEQHVYFTDAGGKKHLLVNLLRDPAMERVIVLHPHQAWRRQGRRASGGSRHSGRGHARQQEPECAPAQPGTVQDRPGRVLVATDLAAAASMSPASRMSSTTSCRTSLRATSIASAARRGLALPASPSPSAIRASSLSFGPSSG